MKPIAHFEGRYEIAEDGSVLNLANNTLLSASLNPKGYLRVGLADGKGGHKQYSVHSLVARHYIPNPYGYSQINHKDGNKRNNHINNLEWCSCAQNAQHALATGLRKGYMPADTKEDLLKRVLLGEQVSTIAIEYSRHPNTLHKMLRNTADRMGVRDQWDTIMKENRKNAAIRNLTKINY